MESILAKTRNIELAPEEQDMAAAQVAKLHIFTAARSTSNPIPTDSPSERLMS